MKLGPKRSWAGLVVGLSVAAVGCEVTTELPTAYPPNPPQGPPVQMPAGAAKGEPSGVGPGKGVGVWIWQQADGVWRIRTATDGSKHVFRGRITGQSSPISWIRTDVVEMGDALTHDKREVIFKFDTSAHVDGIDFVPDDRGCVVVHVTVDERSQPALIRVGAAQTSPTSDHLLLCP